MSKKKTSPKKVSPSKGKTNVKKMAPKPIKTASKSSSKKLSLKKTATKAIRKVSKPAKASPKKTVTKPAFTKKPPALSKKSAAHSKQVAGPKKSAAKPLPKTASKAPASKSTAATPKLAQQSAPPTPAPAPKSQAVKKASKSVTAASGPTKSGALFYDSHMHTPLCKHAWGEPEEYAQQAIKAGLKGIIFTCHAPMPNGFWPTVRMAESEFDTYVALVQRAADAYKGKLHVCLGIESEWFPGYEDYIRELHGRAEFDYVLGAVHWQAKEYLAKFESGTIENFRRIYFDHLAKSAETGLYDCLAHPDLVKNYHPDSWCFAIIKNSVAACLDRIAATGVAMELNTSGLNKSYSEMNPGNEMLRMMAERKIPVVIGSDAHRGHRVGDQFVTALNNLTEAGYEHVSYFQKRQRIDLKIRDVLASLKKAADHNA